VNPDFSSGFSLQDDKQKAVDPFGEGFDAVEV
jgi:hypothetical protein